MAVLVGRFTAYSSYVDTRYHTPGPISRLGYAVRGTIPMPTDTFSESCRRDLSNDTLIREAAHEAAVFDRQRGPVHPTTRQQAEADSAIPAHTLSRLLSMLHKRCCTKRLRTARSKDTTTNAAAKTTKTTAAAAAAAAGTNTNQRTRFLLRRCRAVSSMTNSHVGVGAFHGGEHGTTTAT